MTPCPAIFANEPFPVYPPCPSFSTIPPISITEGLSGIPVPDVGNLFAIALVCVVLFALILLFALTMD